MNPAKFEVWLAQYPWKSSMDARPWVVVETTYPGVYGCFPISGQRYGEPCFEIPRGHPEFAATGLTKTSYVYDGSIIELGASHFLKKKGRMSGSLLMEFLEYSGLPGP